MANYIPEKLPPGFAGKLFVLFFIKLQKIAFQFFNIVYPAKPAEELQCSFG
jgi:hypothetical protein